MTKLNLKEIVQRANDIDWKLWIYSEPHVELTEGLICYTIDVDNTELADDGFTPKIAYEKNLHELLSIHDLQGVLKNIGDLSTVTMSDIIAHVAYYVEFDSYLN